VVSGTGGLIKVGTGALLMYTSNSFSGSFQLLGGTMNVYEAHVLGATNGSTTIAAGTSLALTPSVSDPVPEPFVLAGALVASAPAKILTGPMTLSGSNATITGAITINGPISGSGGFTKITADPLTLNGSNTYTGATSISQGTLVVNGAQPASPIVLSGPSACFLSGTGAVGTITASSSSSATLWPGGASPGILTASNVTLNSSVFLRIRLNGPGAGAGYDQLNVNGSVSLSNAILQVTLGFTPAVGESFVLVNNDGSDAVNGTFGGLPEGAVLNVSGVPFRISYTAGSGNDVVLTRISPPTAFDAISVLTNASTHLQATGALAGFSYFIQAATNLNPVIQWTNVGSVVPGSNGIVSFTDTNAPLFPMRFYRMLSP
jgi:fibronectin-binding autotransporter adhesin